MDQNYFTHQSKTTTEKKTVLNRFSPFKSLKSVDISDRAPPIPDTTSSKFVSGISQSQKVL